MAIVKNAVLVDAKEYTQADWSAGYVNVTDDLGDQPDTIYVSSADPGVSLHVKTAKENTVRTFTNIQAGFSMDVQFNEVSGSGGNMRLIAGVL